MSGGGVHGLVRTAEHQLQQEQGGGGGGGGGRPAVRLQLRVRVVLQARGIAAASLRENKGFTTSSVSHQVY
jgi:hypothetical protein